MRTDRLNLPAILWIGLVVGQHLIATDASAHSLRVLRGTVTITGDTLEVRIEPNHHAEAPRLRLSVRDAEGVGLMGRSESSNPAGARAKDTTARYTLASNARFVSFRLDPPGMGGTRATNVVLTARVNGQDRDPIYLSSSGNVEVLSIAAPTVASALVRSAEGSGPYASRREDWLGLRNGDRSVRSIVAVEDGGVQIDLLIPTPVIETWVPIVRAHRDFIEPEERKRALAELKTFIADRLGVRVDGANALAPTVVASFLDLASPQAAADGESGRLSVWTTGLLFSLQFHSAHRPKHVDVHWKLFNALVLTANALTVTPGGCSEFTFSTYNAHWLWERP